MIDQNVAAVLLCIGYSLKLIDRVQRQINEPFLFFII